MTQRWQPGWYDDPSGDPGQIASRAAPPGETGGPRFAAGHPGMPAAGAPPTPLGRLRWWDGVGWSGITRDRMPNEQEPFPGPGSADALAWSPADVLDADDRPDRSRTAWVAALGILGLIAVLVLTGALPGLGGGGHGSAAGVSVPQVAPLPGPPTLGPSDEPQLPREPVPRPVSGRVADPAAGLSYDVLPGDWRAFDLPPFLGTLGTAGYYRVVQESTPNGGQYWASVTSGPVVPGAVVKGDLGATAGRLVHELDAEYYPKHTRTHVVRRKTTVDGHAAYLYRYLAVFDPAAAKGYLARSEQVIIVVVDTGRDLPSLLYVTLPDLVRSSWPSVDSLLRSVRVLG